MNIYLLVEGQSTEPYVYPTWLSYLLPELKRVDNFDEVEQNNYYLFSSYGIPSVYTDIINAIKDINSAGKYNYFVVCLDADSATVYQRESKVIQLINESNVKLIDQTSLKIIVQNCCIETWFLGNRKVYTRNPQKNSRFIEYARFYNVSQNDPELMEKPESFDGSLSHFHFAYLKAMFNERGNMVYSKSNPREVQKESYLRELQNRVKVTPFHLNSFTNFINFCVKVKTELNSL